MAGFLHKIFQKITCILHFYVLQYIHNKKRTKYIERLNGD